MALTRVGGGLWLLNGGDQSFGNGTTLIGPRDILVDANQEECQLFGRVVLPGGTGSKTFDASGTSAIGWFTGTSITFASGSSLTVGLKKTTIDAANGPAARATLGGAGGTTGFDAYKTLVGGTDTLADTTWYDTVMSTLAAGSITVTHGDLVCVSFCLITSSGTPAVRVRGINGNNATVLGFPCSTLVTSGPTYTAQAQIPNVTLKFSDGTVGWLDGATLFSSGTLTQTIGNTNYYGNIFCPTFNCKIDAVRVYPFVPGGTTNFDVGIWSTSDNTATGTPTAITNGTVSVDPQVLGQNSAGMHIFSLAEEITLTAGNYYFMGVKQNSTTALTLSYYDVNATAHLQASGLDSNCYGVSSTAGAAFTQLNSGKRRFGVNARVSSVDNGAGGGGGGLRLAGHGGLVA